MVNERSLANLKLGDQKKLGGRRVGMRLSGPAIQALDTIAKSHSKSRTWAVELMPELLLTLRACAEEIEPDSPCGQRLASLKVKEIGDRIASLEVLGDEDGDCKGKRDFLEQSEKKGR